MVLTLTCLSTTAFAATEPIEKQTDAKTTKIYYNVTYNGINLKIPNTKEFSAGRILW